MTFFTSFPSFKTLLNPIFNLNFDIYKLPKVKSMFKYKGNDEMLRGAHTKATHT